MLYFEYGRNIIFDTKYQKRLLRIETEVTVKIILYADEIFNELAGVTVDINN